MVRRARPPRRRERTQPDLGELSLQTERRPFRHLGLPEGASFVRSARLSREHGRGDQRDDPERKHRDAHVDGPVRALRELSAHARVAHASASLSRTFTRPFGRSTLFQLSARWITCHVPSPGTVVRHRVLPRAPYSPRVSSSATRRRRCGDGIPSVFGIPHGGSILSRRRRFPQQPAITGAIPAGARSERLPPLRAASRHGASSDRADTGRSAVRRAADRPARAAARPCTEASRRSGSCSRR